MTAPDPRLGEIEARLTAATPGPWETMKSGLLGTRVVAVDGEWDAIVPDEFVTLVTPSLRKPADAEFIAHSPSDVAYLLAELRKRDDALDRVGTVAGSLEARAFMNDRNTAAGLYDEAMELAADAASSIAREAAAQLRAAVTGDGA